MRTPSGALAILAVANPTSAFTFLPDAFSQHRPTRVAPLASFEGILIDVVSSATQIMGVSTSEFTTGIPLAALGAAMAASQFALVKRDGLRKDLNTTQNTLVTKRKQVVATGRKANVRKP
jgi:hypothetical protein